MPSLYEYTCDAAKLVPQLFTDWSHPRFFLQCSSAMNPKGIFDSHPQTVPLNMLPGMPKHEIPDGGHPELMFGKINGHAVLATNGHRHLYEGLGAAPCVLPLCTAHELGANAAILVGAGLSLKKEIKPGNWMLLTDFINGHHCSPLDGNHAMLENPFPDMTFALSQHLNSELVNALDSVGISPKLGVYMSRPGSQFCTVSEANAARGNGADILGHDLVMETIMGHALGMEVSAFALAALAAPGVHSRPLSRGDYLENCRFCIKDLLRGLRTGIKDFLEA